VINDSSQAWTSGHGSQLKHAQVIQGVAREQIAQQSPQKHYQGRKASLTQRKALPQAAGLYQDKFGDSHGIHMRYPNAIAEGFSP